MVLVCRGSGLASIFGASKAMDSGTANLTYTAPKQPKKSKGKLCKGMVGSLPEV